MCREGYICSGSPAKKPCSALGSGIAREGGGDDLKPGFAARHIFGIGLDRLRVAMVTRCPACCKPLTWQTSGFGRVWHMRHKIEKCTIVPFMTPQPNLNYTSPPPLSQGEGRQATHPNPPYSVRRGDKQTHPRPLPTPKEVETRNYTSPQPLLLVGGRPETHLTPAPLQGEGRQTERDKISDRQGKRSHN